MCGRCTAPESTRKKNGGKKERQRSAVARFSTPRPLFFTRNPYTSMLVGLSQQTTPMTTRLKFHGELRGLGHIFSLTHSLFLSRARNGPSLYDPSLRRDCSRSSGCRPLYPTPVTRLLSNGPANPSSLSGDWYATAATPAF